MDFSIDCCLSWSFSCSNSFDNSSNFFSNVSISGVFSPFSSTIISLFSGLRPHFVQSACPSFITLTPLQYGHGSLSRVAPFSNISDLKNDISDGDEDMAEMAKEQLEEKEEELEEAQTDLDKIKSDIDEVKDFIKSNK